MARVIYSLYIDIPENELDFFDKNIIKKNTTPTNLNTKQKLKENYSKLIACKKWYADQIGVPFIMFEYDVNFINSTIYSTIGSLNSLAKVTPGNIGLFEILMISSSSVHGVKINEILTTSIVMRIISYLTIVLIYLYNVINKLSYRGK